MEFRLSKPLMKMSGPEGDGGRVAMLDIVRAIGIIAVAWFHTQHAPRGLLYIFVMPLFFMVSGMFVPVRRSPREFLNTRVKGLAMPLLLFCLIGMALEYWVFDMSGYEEFKDTGFDFVWIHNVTLWYVLVLIYVSTLVYAVERYVMGRIERAAIYLAGTALGVLLAGANHRLPLFLGQTFVALPYFVTGYMLRREIVSGRLFTPGLLAIAAIGAFYGIWYGAINNIHAMKVHGGFFPSYAGGVGITLLLMFVSAVIAEKLRGSRVRKWLVWIGESTLFVVLIHRIPLYALNDKLAEIHTRWLPMTWQMNLMMLGVAIVLVVASILLGKLLSRWLPWFFPAQKRRGKDWEHKKSEINK